jgi:hypothetical protein
VLRTAKAEKAKRQIEEIITHLHLATLMSEKMMSEKKGEKRIRRSDHAAVVELSDQPAVTTARQLR